MIHLIACIDNAGGLGREDGSLLFNIKNDMKRFKDLTQGNIVVLGRKTFESIIEMNGRPLPNRINVVLTRNKKYKSQYGEFVFHDIDKIIKHCLTLTEDDKKVYICGGGELYSQLLSYVDVVHLTIVDKHIEDAEIFYPMNMQNFLGFMPVEEEEHYSDEYECNYKFVTYRRS